LPESRDVFRPFDPKTDPLAEWKTMNKAMTDNPPQARLAKLVELFGKIGVGPEQDVDKMDAGTKRGLARASVDGRKLLNEVIRSGALGTRVNGWNIPPTTLGRAGLHDDFLVRGALQCLAGIVANDPAEAVYFNTTFDSAGRTFDSAKRYTLRFPPGQLPQVKSFVLPGHSFKPRRSKRRFLYSVQACLSAMNCAKVSRQLFASKCGRYRRSVNACEVRYLNTLRVSLGGSSTTMRARVLARDGLCQT
jgi:hypothetical protein